MIVNVSWAKEKANFPFPSLIDIQHLGRRKRGASFREIECIHMDTGNRIIYPVVVSRCLCVQDERVCVWSTKCERASSHTQLAHITKANNKAVFQGYVLEFSANEN